MPVRCIMWGVSSTPSTPTPFSWINNLPFFYGWIMLAIGGLGIFLSAPGQTFVVSIFVNPMIEELEWSRTLISGLYTGGSLTAALLVPLVGRVLDRYGSRVALTGVAVLFGLAVILISQISVPVHLFLGIVAIRALGQGSLSLISTTLVAMWFVKRRGRAIALTTLASPASKVVFPLLVYQLISHMGWRSAWVYLGLIVWIGLIPAVLLLVRRSPESVGLLPDGDRTPTRRGHDTLRYDPVGKEKDWPLHDAMRTRTFWLLLLAGSPQSMLGTALTFHHVSLFASKGFDAGLAAGVLSFMAPMALIGTLVAGWLSDRLPTRFVLAAGLMLFTCTMLLAVYMSSPWQTFVYGGMFGYVQGTLMTTNTVIWPNYFGRTHLGSIRGVASTASVAFAALGPFPFGLMFDLTGDYRSVILAFLILPIVVGMASLFAAPPRRLGSSTMC